MDAVRLRFPDQDRADHPLSIGIHGIGRGGRGGIELVEGDERSAVRLCVDRRGMWLAVDDGAPGVHVNGRQVRRMAMLRVGDAVYVDGVEMRLVSALPPRTVPDAPRDAAADPAPNLRVVLRGVGGHYHGRSFTLERPRLVGRSADADIRIDAPAFAERHARLELIGDEVVLRDLGSGDGSLVNGEPVRDAVLLAGDQVVFDAHHRFVVEAPRRISSKDDEATPGEARAVSANPARPEPGGGAWRLPWLLLAAVAIAVLLALLLLFGSG
ncbi:MAG: FHA domain-containing protein [Luteimonas sp.]|nr:FHA domain-containing protein [Luteimonas sp.]